MDVQTESRKSKRISCLSMVHIEDGPTGNINFGIMHNENSYGMYFESLNGFRPGTIVEIKFDEPSPILNNGLRRARVIWSRKIDNNSFRGYGTGVQYCLGDRPDE